MEVAVDFKTRVIVVTAALLVLFLGALDALVVSAAMPTIVADLGGMHLYSWVFSSYLLTRAISLPIFGKLCDIYSSKKLYVVAVGLFVASSVLCGAADGMGQLIFGRVLQGIGAGGTFALAYFVVTNVSVPENRGKMMGLISFVWGVASILGPAAGGLIVTYLSWRWIFYINAPLGCLGMLGILLYLRELRERRDDATVDFLGALALTALVLAVLILVMLGGRFYPWFSPQIIGLGVVGIISGIGFYYAEKRAAEPILALSFFRSRSFSLANGSAFLCSFSMFTISAFTPFFIQGALGKTPAQLGLTMVALTVGWSGGALVCGQIVNRRTEKAFCIFGSLLLAAGSAAAITFSTSTSLLFCSGAVALAGIGMGFVSIPTLLIVQNSLDPSNLGVATASQQFARNLGGTIGIGISGALVTDRLMKALNPLINSTGAESLPANLATQFSQGFESLFQPEIQASLSAGVLALLQKAVVEGVVVVFWLCMAVSLVSFLCCCLLPKETEFVEKREDIS
ncbi:MAG: MFS transporter [Syntrophobacteraceae bacterium]